MNNDFQLLKIGVALLVCALFVNTAFSQYDPCLLSYNEKMNHAIHFRIYENYLKVKPYFQEAYAVNPTIPQGVLEAVAFQYTRFDGNLFDTMTVSADDMPRTYSVMGLTLDGKGVFRENLRLIAKLSDISEVDIRQNDRMAVLAYASAFAQKQKAYKVFGDHIEDYRPVLESLSELPLDTFHREDAYANFAINSSLYAIYSFLADASNAELGLPVRDVDFREVFGDHLPLLQQKMVNMDSLALIQNSRAADYAGAIWNSAASCNYVTGRNGVTVNNITLHYTAGTYAGSIAWFQNCASEVSAHYVIRSYDGQITQMVRESDKAWHVGEANGYTIGIEHEAYGNVQNFFTPAMYQASADLVKDICRRHPNINPHHLFYCDTLDDGTVLNCGLHNLGGSTACVQIRGHQHFPNQTHTDPGPYWNWNYYYKLVNDQPVITTTNEANGTFADAGGTLSNYPNNARQLFHIHIPGADSVVLSFADFELERNADFMWIYDGPSVFSPLIGRWNTHSPGRVVAHGEDMLVEFRSDCSGTARGWLANWQSAEPLSPFVDTLPPTTQILWDEQQWITHDVYVNFSDADDGALQERFYQLMEKKNGVWAANNHKGFLCDNFDHILDTALWLNDGHWSVQNAALQQTEDTLSACVSALLDAHGVQALLFDFYLSLNAGDTASFFWDGNEPLDERATTFCGYELAICNTDHTLSVYRWDGGHRLLLKKMPHIFFTHGQSYLYRIVWQRDTKDISVYRHAACLLRVRDTGSMINEGLHFVGWKTCHTAVSIDNVRVYASRDDRVLLTVGPECDKMIQAQALNGNSTCKLKSIVWDTAGHFSSLVEKSLLVDYTLPSAPARVDDSQSAKDESSWQSWLVSVKWSSVMDAQSGIHNYEYMLNVSHPQRIPFRLDWVDVGLATTAQCSKSFPDLTRVRVGVRAVDNAGLKSSITYSPGFFVSYDNALVLHKVKMEVTPSPVVDYMVVTDCLSVGAAQGSDEPLPSGKLQCVFYDLQGRHVGQIRGELGESLDLSWLPSGVYLLQITRNGILLQVEKIIKP
ncbi:MAG: N-acetylmuramoyl-L-alanine amidase [Bacteroidales bacterium]|nr:N-acetylmuramoyl-L-alanine amidase [Bacteroidales bacterium]